MIRYDTIQYNTFFTRLEQNYITLPQKITYMHLHIYPYTHAHTYIYLTIILRARVGYEMIDRQ